MANEKSVKLTKFELEVMDALWDAGSASVREIHERLPEKKRVAYTTVQTIVYRLEEKGAVWRSKKIGNAHIFEPLITRKSVHRRLIDDLVDSRWSLTVAGRQLRRGRAGRVRPFVLAARA